MTGLKPKTIDAVSSAMDRGLSLAGIALEADVSLATARKYVKAIVAGISPDDIWQPPRPDERDVEIGRLFKMGRTLQQIGDQFGITRERVRQVLKMHFGVTGCDGGASVVARRKALTKAANRDERYLAKHGCTFAQHKMLMEMGRVAMAAGLPYSRTPIGAYVQQRKNAIHYRDIGWELNLWQWWTIWDKSGRWEQRGRGQGYVMSRKGDTGPYAVWNVDIILASVNTGTSKVKKSSLPLGVRRAKLKTEAYEAARQVNGVKIKLGRFSTPEQAHAAYLAAA